VTLTAFFTGRRLIATLIVLLGVGINFYLANWQYSRHLERIAINERFAERMVLAPLMLDRNATDPAALDYRQVSARGVYDPANEIVLRNRSYGGELGVQLLTPLRLADGSAVLVNRGWVPIAASAPDKRAVYQPPAGEVTITGVARKDQAAIPGPDNPPLQPGETRLDAWFRIDTTRISQQTGYPLLPIFVELQPEPGAPETLPARSKTTDLGPGSHLSYTVQWAGFGIALLVVYAAWVYQREKTAA
jgi:surfeit locus 1 family protein